MGIASLRPRVSLAASAVLAALIHTSGSAVAAERIQADVVLQDGAIYTADAGHAWAAAVAIVGDTIVAVGDDAAVSRLIGPDTRVVDLDGKLVLPGLIDTHMHPILGAVAGTQCSLAGVQPTLEAIKPVVRRCLAERPGGSEDWLEVTQLYNYGFEATATDLDAIESARPLVLWGNDGHTGWVNSRGLTITGVTAETPDPVGGKITRDAAGNPTGSFADAAANLIYDKVPAPTLEERAALTAAELERMTAHGITTLMDAAVTPDLLPVWKKIYEDGKLPLRVRLAIKVEDPSDDSDEAVAALVAATRSADLDPDFLQAGTIKAFADGVIEAPAQTAALLEPYLDLDGNPTQNTGELYFDPERFARLVTKLDAAGLSVHIHAIGDRAVRSSLDAIAMARATNGNGGPRHQIAHLQLVDPADFPRFKALDVIADIQFEWGKRDPSDEGPIEPYLGPERYRYLYPTASLLEAGATIAAGSDWDISSYDPVDEDRGYARRPEGAPTATQRGTGDLNRRGGRRLHHQRRGSAGRRRPHRQHRGRQARRPGRRRPQHLRGSADRHPQHHGAVDLGRRARGLRRRQVAVRCAAHPGQSSSGEPRGRARCRPPKALSEMAAPS
jgi:predicted amidohydrolase YtcJ